ncbi:MAG: hypothetical protein HC938_17090 [Nitrospira sp.]|nr:hypothetical protein [Nitrospira sp.]
MYVRRLAKIETAAGELLVLHLQDQIAVGGIDIRLAAEYPEATAAGVSATERVQRRIEQTKTVTRNDSNHGTTPESRQIQNQSPGVTTNLGGDGENGGPIIQNPPTRQTLHIAFGAIRLGAPCIQRCRRLRLCLRR